MLLSRLECTLDLFPLASPNVRFTSLVGHEHHHDMHHGFEINIEQQGAKKKKKNFEHTHKRFNSHALECR